MKSPQSSKSEEIYLEEAIRQLPSYSPPEGLWFLIEDELSAPEVGLKINWSNKYSFAMISLAASICLIIGILIGFNNTVHDRNSENISGDTQIYSAAPSAYSESWEEEIEIMYQGTQRPDLETLATELNESKLFDDQQFMKIKREWDELKKIWELMKNSGMSIPPFLHAQRTKILQSYEIWRWKHHEVISSGS